MSWTPSVIVTDIDGTLIDSHERIPAATFDALTRAIHAGARVVLATGRPPRWIGPTLAQLPYTPDATDYSDPLRIRPHAVCANGALIYDSAADTLIAKNVLNPQVMRTITRIVGEVLPHAGFAVERPGMSIHDPEHELYVVTEEYAPTWDSDSHGVEPLGALVRMPATKLLARCQDMDSTRMCELVAPHIPADLAQVTYSMHEGLLEFSAPGISKATGLQALGLDPDEVLAFGDMPNDNAMLAWARVGVAVPDAHPTTVAAADEQGSIADVLARYF
ncbi:MAG: HAD family hydrolase [Corynebacterium sp.]|nr:HAD family hydrolase [Corynebacterium sp.]